MEPYGLETPLWSYLVATGAAVAVFAVIVPAVLLRTNRWRGHPRVMPLKPGESRFFGHPVCLGTIKTISVALLALVVAVGMFGEQNPYRNPAPIAVWAVVWVGMAAVSATLGNLWALINPWAVLFGWAEALLARRTPGRPLHSGMPYPEGLGVWPAAVLFMVLVWTGLALEVGQTPERLAWVIAAYSAISWTGMALFGKDVWVANGEAVAQAFSLLARLAPTQIARVPEGSTTPTMCLRLPASGLLTGRPLSWALTVMVLSMLAAAVFDGLVETRLWSGLHDWLLTDRIVWPLVSGLLELGLGLPATIKTVAFAGCAAAVIGAYLLAALIAAWAGGGASASEVCRALVLSLVPVAAILHLAHHLPEFGMATRQLAALAADPFGLGYALWEVPDPPDAARPNGRFAWFATLAAVLVGHLLALGILNATAMRRFKDARSALSGQSPVAILLLGSATGSLWILAQPFIQAGILPR